MKKIILYTVFLLMVCQLKGQNSIGLEVGFLGSQTRIAEYLRPDQQDYLLDFVSLNQYAPSLHAAIIAGLDLGKDFFLSTGFHYEQKGLSKVSYTDSNQVVYDVKALQNYLGLSLMIQYRLHFRESKFGMLLGTGPKFDFAVGTPNGGALYSGKYRKYLMPFSRFNEVDVSWGAEVGGTYSAGPGDFILKISYLYGFSDVLEDAFIVGRSQSLGISIGYSFNLSRKSSR